MAITVTEYPSSCASSRLYLVNIHNIATINTTVTAHPVVVHYWLRYILRRPRLLFSLGVHFPPPTPTTTTNDRPASVLQLSVHHYCLIFQFSHAAYVPGILRWVLFQPWITVVGLYTQIDTIGMALSRHRLRMWPGMLVDLRELATDREGRQLRSGFLIAEIVRRAIGVDMEWDWDVCQSDWDAEVLSVGQVKHAAVYGYACYEIGVVTRAWMYPRLLPGLLAVLG
ncbi:hypothetical protein RND81_05G113100 [Saponaria officinalis]|uniref:Uncharacterized protein n=1 Tax=Saponaria officinalis TaxID=3572 RepID=A0AAW1KZU7_SAPOF